MLLILFSIRTRRVVSLQILWPSQFTQIWPKCFRVHRHFDEGSCSYPRCLYHCAIARTWGRGIIILAVTKQFYEWYFLSVCLSVCPSVTPFYPSALRAGGVLSSRFGRAGGWAGGCQTFGTHISVTAMTVTSITHVWQRRSRLLPSTSDQPLYIRCPWSRLNPTSKAACVCSQLGPTSCHEIMVSLPFTKSKTIFQIDMFCMQCFLKSKFIKSRTFNDKNRWIIKKVMVLKKLLPHLATRGPYSPGGWRCDEAWREQTFVYPPVMCQQRLSYCTWELNVMLDGFSPFEVLWNCLGL